MHTDALKTKNKHMLQSHLKSQEALWSVWTKSILISSFLSMFYWPYHVSHIIFSLETQLYDAVFVLLILCQLVLKDFLKLYLTPLLGRSICWLLFLIWKLPLSCWFLSVCLWHYLSLSLPLNMLSIFIH